MGKKPRPKKPVPPVNRRRLRMSLGSRTVRRQGTKSNAPGERRQKPAKRLAALIANGQTGHE